MYQYVALFYSKNSYDNLLMTVSLATVTNLNKFNELKSIFKSNCLCHKLKTLILLVAMVVFFFFLFYFYRGLVSI